MEKTLSQASETMLSGLKNQITATTHPHGSKMSIGTQSGSPKVYRQGPAIKTKDQATQIRSWVLRLKSPDPDKELYVEGGQIKFREIPPMTQDQINLAIEAQASLSPDVVKYHLKKLAIRKRISGSEEQIQYILRDDAARLAAAGVCEYNLFLAIDWFIEHDESDWYPQYSNLRKKCLI